MTLGERCRLGGRTPRVNALDAALEKTVAAPVTVLDRSTAENKDAVVVSKAVADRYHAPSRSAPAGPGASSGGDRGHRVLGPVVFRVAAAKLGAHLGITADPE